MLNSISTASREGGRGFTQVPIFLLQVVAQTGTAQWTCVGPALVLVLAILSVEH